MFFFAKATNAQITQNIIMHTINLDGTITTTLTKKKERTLMHFISLFDYKQRNPLLPNMNIIFLASIINKLNAWLYSYPRFEEVSTLYEG